MALPWTSDLASWPAAGYVFSFEGDYKDYKVILCRSPWKSWNVYVQVPAGHIARAATHYSFFNINQDGCMPAPFELTYGGVSAAPLPLPIKVDDVSGIFGFDHCWQGRDLMPTWPMPQAPGAVFTTREMAKEEGVKLMKYFHFVGKERVSNILRCPRYFCEQCHEFHHEETKLVEGKQSCAECEEAVRKEARDIRIAVADASNYVKQRQERAVAVASAGAAANKGDAANASAIYAAMMAKKKGKGKGGKKGGR